MPRKPRVDVPGTLHHVMNRGVGRRPIFERQDDFRCFKTLLACAVRARRIRLHGFALMSNHYHLLVESLNGRIGETMRLIQGHYAGRFNRTRDRRRPGHLFGARFKSVRVQGATHLFMASRYIDLNPVKAGLCRAPWEYPHGSARSLLVERRLRPWLCKATLDRFVAGQLASGRTRLEAYKTIYGGTRQLDALRVVASCLDAPKPDALADLDGLLGGDHANTRAWLEARAREADGTRVSMPLVHPDSVQRAVEPHRTRAAQARLSPRAQLSLWDVVEAGLLRDLAGLGFRELGAVMAVSSSAAANRHGRHRRALEEDSSYAGIVARCARQALENCYGARAGAIAREVVERRVSPGVVESAGPRSGTPSGI